MKFFYYRTLPHVDVTRIKPRSAANACNQHLNIPNINTPGKTTIKQLIHNTYSVNSVSLLSKARPANKYDCSKDKTVPIRLTLSFSRHWIRSPKLHDDAVGCQFPHFTHRVCLTELVVDRVYIIL